VGMVERHPQNLTHHSQLLLWLVMEELLSLFCSESSRLNAQFPSEVVREIDRWFVESPR
jgi:chorismate mutase